MTNYEKWLKDPRWLAKRARIVLRDGMRCRYCGEEPPAFEVHHFHYAPSGKPWEVPDTSLITLCPSCHELVMKGWFRTPETGQREMDRMERRLALAREFAKPEYEGLTPETLYHHHRLASCRMDRERMLRNMPACTCVQCKAAKNQKPEGERATNGHSLTRLMEG